MEFVSLARLIVEPDYPQIYQAALNEENLLHYFWQELNARILVQMELMEILQTIIEIAVFILEKLERAQLHA